MRQLIIPLDLPPSLGEEDFLVAPANAQAHGFLSRWPQWPDRVAVLTGPAGAGKTHLAAIWSAYAGATMIAAHDLSDAIISGWEEGAAFALDALAPGRVDERLLFHALNTVRERNGWLLLVMEPAPGLWSFATADLASRLRLATLLEIGLPGDALVRAVFVKILRDRQLAVDADVLEYVLARIDRSLATVRAVCAALDEEAVSRGRRVTKPLAADVLARFHLEHDTDENPAQLCLGIDTKPV